MSGLDDIFRPVYAGSYDDNSVTKAKQDVEKLLADRLSGDEWYAKLIHEVSKEYPDAKVGEVPTSAILDAALEITGRL